MNSLVTGSKQLSDLSARGIEGFVSLSWLDLGLVIIFDSEILRIFLSTMVDNLFQFLYR